MSSGIATETEALQMVLDRLGYDYQDALSTDMLDRLLQGLKVPDNYRTFLTMMSPDGAELRAAQMSVVLAEPSELLDLQARQRHRGVGDVVVGTLHDYPLVSALGEAESREDAPLYKVMDQERVLVASSFLQFLQMLRLTLEMGVMLADEDDGYGEDDEDDATYDPYEGGGLSSRSQEQEYAWEEYAEELERIDPEAAAAWLRE
jgi:hypothetical protein